MTDTPEVEVKFEGQELFWPEGRTAPIFLSKPAALVRLGGKDGEYKLGDGGVEGLLNALDSICRAFGHALQDQYDAGRASVLALSKGALDRSENALRLAEERSCGAIAVICVFGVLCVVKLFE